MYSCIFLCRPFFPSLNDVATQRIIVNECLFFSSSQLKRFTKYVPCCNKNRKTDTRKKKCATTVNSHGKLLFKTFINIRSECCTNAVVCNNGKTTRSAKWAHKLYTRIHRDSFYISNNLQLT